MDGSLFLLTQVFPPLKVAGKVIYCVIMIHQQFKLPETFPAFQFIAKSTFSVFKKPNSRYVNGILLPWYLRLIVNPVINEDKGKQDNQVNKCIATYASEKLKTTERKIVVRKKVSYSQLARVSILQTSFFEK